jgi:rhamnose transport system ATP-binding protein
LLQANHEGKPLSVPALQIENVSKTYGGACALRNVSFQLMPGEVHALCGENGAGKSTLIKVLTGTVNPDGGAVFCRGKPLRMGSVAASEAAGIGVVHQELMAFPDLNAIDNLFVGREIRCAGGWFLDRRRMRQQTRELLDRLGESFDLDRPLRDLSLAQRQMVAVARALLLRCRVVILDEPTASLSLRESQQILRMIRQLKADGVSVLYVSHRLEEIFQIADRATVLRDGELVSSSAVADLTQDQLIRQMVGREIAELETRHGRDRSLATPRLAVRGLTRDGAFRDVSFEVRSGEIVVLAGLVGAGRSEVARCIFGIDRADAGSVQIEHRSLRPGAVPHAIRAGVALVPEDRQHEGLVLPMSVASNLTLAVLKRVSRLGLLCSQQEKAVASEQIDRLGIKVADDDNPVSLLSGGNQQKVVLGRWLASEPRVLILDEPTRGVDVGAKAQVHRLVRELAASGMATLVISSDLTEVLSIADRILVMREGSIVGEFPGWSVSQEQLLERMLPR